MGLFDFLKSKSKIATTELTDVDGNVYQTVKIGNQVWTVENFKTTKYNNGAPIPLVTDNNTWINISTPGYCWYNNDINNRDKYGALYNRYAIVTKKFAPKGWHVPFADEWDTLMNYLIANGFNWDGTTGHNKIAKSLAAKTDWKIDTSGGSIGNDLTKNNHSGFSALPSGLRLPGGSLSNGEFGRCGTNCNWWSATASYTGTSGCSYNMDHNDEKLFSSDGSHFCCGLSVRLLKD